MKKICFLLVLLIFTSGNAFAEFVFGPQLTVVGSRAYLIETIDNASTLKQYSFPNLVETKNLLLTPDEFPIIQAFESGLTIETYTFTESESTVDEVKGKLKTRLQRKVKASSGDETVTVFTETVTIKSYDTDLNEVATLVNENSFAYITLDKEEVSSDEVSSGDVVFTKGSKKCKPKRKKGQVCAKVSF
jgi:hypothetical protein